jgi:hypothetical protein
MRIICDYCCIPFFATLAFVNIIASRPDYIVSLPWNDPNLSEYGISGQKKVILNVEKY